MRDGTDGGLRHDLLLYDTEDQFVSTVRPFVDEGVAGGEVVVVQLPASSWKALAGADFPAEVIRNPLDDLCPHPHQAFWGFVQALQSEMYDRAALRIVAQVDAATRTRDPAEWGRLEAVINHVLRRHDLYGLCTYDRRRMPDLVLENGMLTHRHTSAGDGWRRNDRYRDPRDVLRELDGRRSPDPLEATAPMADQPLLTMSDLASARHQLELALQMTLLSADRRSDFVAAVFEVAVNALLHGGPKAMVRLWVGPHRILCRVRDTGPGPTDPLMGYEPPGPHRETPGHGLWSARQLCDSMTTSAEPEGFTVRLGADF